MKKKLLILFVVFCLFIAICYYISLPDYYICNSVSFGSCDTRDTKLNVIIYKYWDISNVIKEIEEKHNRINGIPTTLTINLYYSNGHFLYGNKPFKTVVLYDN